MSDCLVIIVCIFLFSPLVVCGQSTLSLHEMQSRIVSPVKHAITLSGSYGELRSTHFHAGIDIRPSSDDAKDEIVVVDDGYISRIRVQTGGFGKSVYVIHPETGYTTVYAHLDRFNNELETHVSKVQFARKSYSVNLDIPRNYFKVKKGQVIGIMGNTGQSFGTHLHFEIRETTSERPVNPALAGLKAPDQIPPTIVGVAIHGLTQDFHKSEQVIYIPESNKDINHISMPTIELVSDRAGIAIEAFDRMNGSPNKNGIYQLRMYDETGLKYSYVFNRFSFAESNQIVGFIDFGMKQTSGSTYALCYKLPGVNLSFLNHKDTGILSIKEGELKYFCIEIDDFESNTTSFEAYIRRVDVPAFQEFTESEGMVYEGQRFVFEKDSCRITIHEESLFRNIRFEYELTSDSICVACYRLHKATEPIKKAIDIRLPVPEPMKIRKEKVIVFRHDVNGKKINHGGKYESGFIGLSTRFFGKYEVNLDTIPPTIIPIKFNKNIKNYSEFVFEVKDDLETAGNARELTYHVTIDGILIICPYKSLTKILQIPLKNISAGKHQLKISATDHSGNRGEFVSTFLKN